MSAFKLILLSFKHHLQSQLASPANFFAAIFGMIINNFIVLWGLWVMLFSGKPQGSQLTVYFLTLNAMIVLAWGIVCFFLGGLYNLGEYIEDGALEPMLATPRHPLLLVGVSRSILPALGDIIQAFINITALFFLASPAIALKCLALTVVSAIAALATFILTGSVPFYLTRGNNVALLLREVFLSLSFYPTGKIFSDSRRLLLFATPAAATAILPMEAIENSNFATISTALLATGVLLFVAISVFNLGLRKYQSSSFIRLR